MSWVRGARSRRSAVWTVAAIAVVLLVTGARPAPAGAMAQEFVFYYTVTSAHQGQPETLAEIARRFLGNSSRSIDIFNLNAGREQPVGGALTDTDELRAGWYLVLPWDAVGPGVQHGLLPTTVPPTPGNTPAPGSVPSAGPGPGGPGQFPGGPGQSRPQPPASLTPGPETVPSSRPPAAPETGKCVAATAASEPSNWAMMRLSAEQAWPHSRGVGQLVALVDSGVDGRQEQLGGRVALGANIVTGDGRGDSDCLGTGTAMAGLVAAQPVEGGTFVGVAPESVVMPVRVVTDGTAAAEADQAAAIEVAVSAGATVIALGSYVDVTLAGVVDAIERAHAHDIVVVAGAPADTAGSVAVAPPAELITVGGVGADGRFVEEYAPDSVDVVAPGINVSSIGINGTKQFVGTGTQYAVALVAGQAALVRSAHPDLSAAQVAHRVLATADEPDDSQPAGQYGSGMINLEAAVTRELPEEAVPLSPERQPDPAARSGGDGVRIAFLLTVLAGLVLSALLVFRLRRSMRLADAEADGEGGIHDSGSAADRPADDPTGQVQRQQPTPAGSK